MLCLFLLYTKVTQPYIYVCVCVCIYIYILFLFFSFLHILFLFHYGLSQAIGYSSLCYTVRYCLSILYIIAYIC